MSTSENEQLRTEVAQLRRQLDAANTGFEEFVSTAAHNLRQSLRDVLAFSQLLAQAHTTPDPDADMFVERVQDGSARMQSLLSDVVDYWGCSSSDLQVSPIELEAALRQALMASDLQIGEARAEVTHDVLPWVMGNLEILTKVLHHLIRNAIEYSDTAVRHVHVSSRRSAGDWVMAVKDDGLGVEARFHDRIFLPFTRLHGKEYPGNGLGLALCRKALADLGGRIWIESAAGTGSTFFFTVPAAD